MEWRETHYCNHSQFYCNACSYDAHSKPDLKAHARTRKHEMTEEAAIQRDNEIEQKWNLSRTALIRARLEAMLIDAPMPNEDEFDVFADMFYDYERDYDHHDHTVESDSDTDNDYG
jgi:hypothetical protein